MATTPNLRAQEQRQKLMRERSNQLKGQIEEIAQALQSVGESDRVRMPERIFVGIWLPFFAGDKDPTYKVDFTHWVNFTGSPYRVVDVVNPQGQVLFTVPALMDRNAINPLGEQARTSISHVVHSAQQWANVHPMQGQAYLDKELTQRALVMKVPANVVKDLETWNAIFKRYGRPPLAELAAAKPNQPSAAAASGSESLEYDLDPL